VVAEQHFFKKLRNCDCGIVIAEVLPSSCGIAIVDSKKSCAFPPLFNSKNKQKSGEKLPDPRIDYRNQRKSLIKNVPRQVSRFLPLDC
jgi:hypothetical protein